MLPLQINLPSPVIKITLDHFLNDNATYMSLCCYVPRFRKKPRLERYLWSILEQTKVTDLSVLFSTIIFLRREATLLILSFPSVLSLCSEYRRCLFHFCLMDFYFPSCYEWLYLCLLSLNFVCFHNPTHSRCLVSSLLPPLSPLPFVIEFSSTNLLSMQHQV